jgi:hypothetical protein
MTTASAFPASAWRAASGWLADFPQIGHGPSLPGASQPQHLVGDGRNSTRRRRMSSSDPPSGFRRCPAFSSRADSHKLSDLPDRLGCAPAFTRHCLSNCLDDLSPIIRRQVISIKPESVANSKIVLYPLPDPPRQCKLDTALCDWNKRVRHFNRNPGSRPIADDTPWRAKRRQFQARISRSPSVVLLLPASRS